MRILGKAGSINVRKVLWTASELGIPLEREDWGSGFRSTQEPEFLALNPNAMVPVLVDGDAVLWESNTISRYLATRYGDGRLLPADALARAKVEQWMDWQATELNNAWRYAFMGLVRGSPAHQDPVQIAAGIAGVPDDGIGGRAGRRGGGGVERRAGDPLRRIVDVGAEEVV